jgi:hypothetical protein
MCATQESPWARRGRGAQVRERRRRKFIRREYEHLPEPALAGERGWRATRAVWRVGARAPERLVRRTRLFCAAHQRRALASELGACHGLAFEPLGHDQANDAQTHHPTEPRARAGQRGQVERRRLHQRADPHASKIRFCGAAGAHSDACGILHVGPEPLQASGEPSSNNRLPRPISTLRRARPCGPRAFGRGRDSRAICAAGAPRAGQRQANDRGRAPHKRRSYRTKARTPDCPVLGR